MSSLKERPRIYWPHQNNYRDKRPDLWFYMKELQNLTSQGSLTPQGLSRGNQQHHEHMTGCLDDPELQAEIKGEQCRIPSRNQDNLNVMLTRLKMAAKQAPRNLL